MEPERKRNSDGLVYCPDLLAMEAAATPCPDLPPASPGAPGRAGQPTRVTRNADGTYNRYDVPIMVLPRGFAVDRDGPRGLVVMGYWPGGNFAGQAMAQTDLVGDGLPPKLAAKRRRLDRFLVTSAGSGEFTPPATDDAHLARASAIESAFRSSPDVDPADAAKEGRRMHATGVGSEDHAALTARRHAGRARERHKAVPAQRLEDVREPEAESSPAEDEACAEIVDIAALAVAGGLSKRDAQLLALSAAVGVDDEECTFGSREHRRRLNAAGFEISQPGLLKMAKRIRGKLPRPSR